MRVCKKCGEQREDVGRCSNCNREYQKKYYLENHEKHKERSIKWRLENPDYQRKYRLENPEKINEGKRKWCLENREKEKERSRKYRLENPEIYKKTQIRRNLKNQIGETPPPELVEIKLLINKTKQLCKTLKN
jgi:hypothetical protein